MRRLELAWLNSTTNYGTYSSGKYILAVRAPGGRIWWDPDNDYDPKYNLGIREMFTAWLTAPGEDIKWDK